MATKGNSFRGLDMRELEGGIGGAGGGGSGFRSAMSVAAPAAVAGTAAAVLKNAQIENSKRRKEEDEAASEMKREARGIEKTSSDRAREAADDASMQRKIDKAAENASKNMAKGGMTASRRADGIATKGKTRGKFC